MNRSLALDILQLSENPTHEQIKKQYRIMALRYHPDKNRENNEKAVEQFQTIYSAYEFLLINENDKYGETNNIYAFDEEIRESLDFDNILRLFLDSVLNDENIIFKKILIILIPKIINILKSINTSDISKIRSILQPIDKTILGKIGDFFNKYKVILEGLDIENITNILVNLSNPYTNSFQNIPYDKDKETDKYNHILLHPLLEDLFQNNIYRCIEYGETLLIPLWHHELVYDLCGCEVLVECYPILPDNITIDNSNNIHVILEYGIMELWFLDKIYFELGNENFSIERNLLKMTENQVIILEGQGISQINEMNIYSIDEKSDIYVYITIRVG